MTASAPDPYAPPGSNVDGALPPSTFPATSARIAGVFLAIDALVVSGGRALRSWQRTTEQGVPDLAIAWSVAPLILVFLIDALLAVPLLLGSTRFRVVTWVRAGLGLAAGVGMTLTMYASMKTFAPERAQAVMDQLGEQIARGALFGVALLLLVTRRPSRWRMIVG